MASGDDAGSAQYGPPWLWALGFALAVFVPGVTLLTGALWLMHDHYEIQAWPHFQLFAAASRVRKEALAAGGRFVEGSAAVRELIAQQDPWGRAFRFEVLDGDGRHARVYSLGHDDRPGGEGCDADIVWWIDAHDELPSWDLEAPPKAWTDAGWGR